MHKNIVVKDKKPDFYVETQWGDFFVEVESFKKLTDIDENPNPIGTSAWEFHNTP